MERWRNGERGEGEEGERGIWIEGGGWREKGHERRDRGREG